MSGETEQAVSGWTTDTLRAHMDALFEARVQWMDERDKRYEERFIQKDLRDQQRFDAQQKALTDALLAQEKAVGAALQAANAAVGKAETANEKRLDGVNEFRRTVEDLMTLAMGKAEANPQFQALREKLADLTERFTRNEVLVTQAVIRLPEITTLADRMNRGEGRGSGFASSGSIAMALVTVASVAAAIIFAIVK